MWIWQQVLRFEDSPVQVGRILSWCPKYLPKDIANIAAEWTEFTWNGLSYSITYIAFIYFFEVTIYHKIMKTQWLYFLVVLTHHHLAIPLVGSWQNWLVMCTLTISSDQTILCTQTVRQNFKTLCLRWPSMFWLPKGSGRTFLSLPLLRERRAARCSRLGFIQPPPWLSVIHTQQCKKCNMRLILSA